MGTAALRGATRLLLPLLLASLALPASAGGRRDKAPAEEVTPLTLLIVRKAGIGPAAPALSTRLPMEITPYLWNEFTVKDGRAESSADGAYREEGSMGVTRERSGDLELERVEMRVASPGVSGSRSVTAAVSFSLDDLLDPTGGVRVQPGQLALLRAILESGRKTGWARVLEVVRVGARGLSARVVLR
jgi:hypothetical protein